MLMTFTLEHSSDPTVYSLESRFTFGTYVDHNCLACGREVGSEARKGERFFMYRTLALRASVVKVSSTAPPDLKGGNSRHYLIKQGYLD